MVPHCILVLSHYSKHNCIELLKSWWIVYEVYVELIDYWGWLWLFVIVFLLIIVIWCTLIFYNKLTLAFCTMWLMSVMISNFRLWEQMSSNRCLWREVFCWSRQADVITLEFLLGELCFIIKLFLSWFLDVFGWACKFQV